MCVVDDPTKVLAVGETGENPHQGPNVTKGYWNKRRKPPEAFVGDRFLTATSLHGDRCYFYLVDRKKDMIISGASTSIRR